MKSYIKCINVDYESSRVEDFYGRPFFRLSCAFSLSNGELSRLLTFLYCLLLLTDIQLNVKGCKTLVDSFRNYIDVETMDGENKYQAEGHGLQASLLWFTSIQNGICMTALTFRLIQFSNRMPARELFSRLSHQCCICS